MRLYVNGQLLINEWTTRTFYTTRTTNITLTAGQVYDVKLELFRGASSSSMAKLWWSSASQPQQIIPFRLDTDGDGLFDDEEAALGTNPNVADSDGDGLSDFQEMKLLQSNPNVSDVPLGSPVISYGNQFSSTLGQWVTSGTTVYAQDRRGYVEYQMVVGTGGVYMVTTTVGEKRVFAPPRVSQFDLTVFVDGEPVGRKIVSVTAPATGQLAFLTPYLGAGTHTVRIYWNNAASLTSLLITQVSLRRLLDESLATNYVANRNGIDSTQLLTSYVSPVCVEGQGAHRTLMQAIGFLPDSSITNVAILAAPNERWYANVPLSPTGAVTFVNSYESGGFAQSNNLQWVARNVLEGGRMIVRTGDSVKFTAQPPGVTNGTVTISLGGTNYQSTVASPVIVQFNQPGTNVVSGTYVSEAGVANGFTMQVVALSHQFSTNYPVALVGVPLTWTNYNVAAGTVLDGDTRLLLTFLSLDADEDRLVAARAGTGGPIMAVTKLQGITVWDPTQSYNNVIQFFPDGSLLIESLIVVSRVFPGMTITVQCAVGGLTFDDGTTTKTLTAADFDALGQCKLRFLKAPHTTNTANCHTITIFNNGTLIGTK
jgi:hypothetical protein